MKYYRIILFGLILSGWLFGLPCSYAQTLKLPVRKANALSGTAFARLIADSSLSLAAREKIIYKAIKKGNIPGFLRKIVEIRKELTVNETKYILLFYTLPDYLAIGSDTDFFYIPMTPVLAQRIANRLHCSLPTKKMVDLIYERATLKLVPLPIPPTAAMVTVPVFEQHNQMVREQLKAHTSAHQQGALTAGNKKDIIISNTIYTEKTPKVVIYGWHQLNGKAIQPVYNKHTHTWADYSHGVRLIQQSIWLNGKKTSLSAVLADKELHVLLSDEGQIERPFYPVLKYE